MTDGERISAALVLSLAVHWLVLGCFKPEAPSAAVLDYEDVAVIDFSGTDIGISLATPITLEQLLPAAMQEAPSPEAAAAERRREALSKYLDQVSTAIHARRQIAGTGRRLVGNAIVRLTIDDKGLFSSVAVIRSSDNAELDADAEQAVRTASGVIPRPHLLGTAPMTIAIAVKYQLGL